MIVVAIVGILAAIALPIYQDYIARSQVAESVAAAAAVKTSITVSRAANGAWPAAGVFNDILGGRYTSSVTHDGNGVITARMRATAPTSSRVRGFTWQLTPTLSMLGGSEIIDWTCGNPSPATSLKYIPTSCQ